MRSVFIAVLLSLIPFGSLAQDSPTNPDGRMWETWSNSTGSQSSFIKAAYVQGAIEGLRVGALLGYYSGRIDEKTDALEYVKPCLKGPCASISLASLIKPFSNSSTKEVEAGATKVREGFTPQHVSVLDIVHQMDKFYANYRNTPVCMITAVQESISSLRGTASSEQELEMARKGCNP
jgi:hypothetical protein